MLKEYGKGGKINIMNGKVYHFNVPVYQQIWENYPLSGAVFPQTPLFKMRMGFFGASTFGGAR